jgi:hypothetical protein
MNRLESVSVLCWKRVCCKVDLWFCIFVACRTGFDGQFGSRRGGFSFAVYAVGVLEADVKEVTKNNGSRKGSKRCKGNYIPIRVSFSMCCLWR